MATKFGANLTPKLWPKIEIQDGGRPPSWNSYITTLDHPQSLFVDISLSNFVLIQYVVLKIWGFEFFAELA